MYASSERLTTAISTRMRGNMIEQASTIAEAKVFPSSGASLLFCENDSVTAVLETRPPVMPVSMSPFFDPSTFTITYPKKLMPAISTTLYQTWRGLSTSSGPNVASGSTGSTMAVMIANFSVA
jgi:hypothetical protein